MSTEATRSRQNRHTTTRQSKFPISLALAVKRNQQQRRRVLGPRVLFSSARIQTRATTTPGPIRVYLSKTHCRCRRIARRLFCRVKHIPIVFRSPCQGDRTFYERCFCSKAWVLGYQIELAGVRLQKRVEEVGYREYRGVYRWIVERREEPIAFANICNPNEPENRSRCFLVGGVDPEQVGRGVGIQVTCVAANVAFGMLGFNKIVCRVLERNAPSSRMLLRCGFQLEGISRCHEQDETSGSYLNVLFFGLLKSEFPNDFASSVLKRIKYEIR